MHVQTIPSTFFSHFSEVKTAVLHHIPTPVGLTSVKEYVRIHSSVLTRRPFFSKEMLFDVKEFITSLVKHDCGISLSFFKLKKKPKTLKKYFTPILSLYSLLLLFVRALSNKRKVSCFYCSWKPNNNHWNIWQLSCLDLLLLHPIW